MNPGRFSLSAFFLLVQITSGLPVTDSGGENATHFTSCPGDEVPSNYFARALSNPKDINGRYPNGTTVDLCCAGESPCIFSDTKPKASTCVNGRWTQKMCCPRNCPVLNETYLASTCGSMELPPGGSISYSPADDENGRYPNGTKATLCCTLIDFCTWDENDPEKVSVCVDGGWTNVFLKCPTVKDNGRYLMRQTILKSKTRYPLLSRVSLYLSVVSMLFEV